MFRWGFSVVTIVVVARILLDWFHVRQHWRSVVAVEPNSFLRSFDSYVIANTNSSLRTHLSLGAVVLLGILQILLVWVSHLERRRWWLPIIVEVGICTCFAVAADQVLGGYPLGCHSGGPSTFTCIVLRPYILGDGWLAVAALIGVLIGLLWSWAGRPSSDADGHTDNFSQDS